MGKKSGTVPNLLQAWLLKLKSFVKVGLFLNICVQGKTKDRLVF